jgi:WD40 repeat protein
MRASLLTGLVALGLFCGSGAARAQNDRFDRKEPGLIVSTNGRMGACDVITFTPDGERLLAAGDDKVVPVWKFDNGQLTAEPEQTLRWSIFREVKGAIYALALSPKDARRVAVGGSGVRVGAAAIIDRQTGDVLHGLIDSGGDNSSIWALAFAPSGNRVACGKGDGSVVVWDLDNKKMIEAARRGKVEGTGAFNRVRLVAFVRENELLSVSENGEVARWTWGADPGKMTSQTVARASKENLGRSAISPDFRTVAVIKDSIDREQVELISLTGGAARKISLPQDHPPQCLAFDATSGRLAIGTRVVPVNTTFRKEIGGDVFVYDVTTAKPRIVSQLAVSNQVEAVAFHPEGKYLAVAGGDDHEVSIWELKEPDAKRVSEVRSPGSSLWAVALSSDSRYVGFKDQRVETPVHPNSRGKGPWRVFDLQQPRWVPAPAFKPIVPERTVDGWSISFTGPNDEKSSFHWYAVSPEKKYYPLAFSQREYFPRCYTFLPRKDGKPLRLVVGHYWGASLYELTTEKGQYAWKRTRMFVGHQGEVMAVAVSEDQKTLVTASNDQTLAGWALADWPAQRELGVRFQLIQGKIKVADVDAGSPGWEAGLTPGDQVLSFVYEGRDMYDPANHLPKAMRSRFKETYTTPDACLARLRDPEPWKECYFKIQRDGEKELLDMATTVRQRPLWRFFPTRDGEWVLWRWRDYYYTASTNGDQYIGWQVSGDVDKTPLYYRAEQFRKRFYNPDKVAETLAGRQQPERIRFPEIEPPEVRLAAQTTEVNTEDVSLNLTIRPRNKLATQNLARVMLWINDYQYKSWGPGASGFQADNSFELKDLAIPNNLLRHGENLIIVQGYNLAGGRGEAPPVRVVCRRPAPPPKLFGLVVAIGDYRRSELRKKGSPFVLGDLKADKDGEVMLEVWEQQKHKLFKDSNVQALFNRDATPEAVLARLRAFQDQVKPDDRLVLFLGGHGLSAEVVKQLVADAKKRKLPLKITDELSPGTFAMLGPQFDLAKPNDTALTTQRVYDVIAKINCHKLILLDACHSGTIAVAVNPIRELTRDGVGPVIIAACQPGESAIEMEFNLDDPAYGLFAQTLRRALAEDFALADKDGDGILTITELREYVRDQLPRLVERIRKQAKPGEMSASDTQTPSFFLPRLEEGLPWAKK